MHGFSELCHRGVVVAVEVVETMGGRGNNGGRGNHSNQPTTEVEGSSHGDASQSANDHDAPATNMRLNKWLAMRLDTFDGTGTPMEAASWLRTMEKYMGASVMTPEERVIYVAFQLKGLADDWWEGVRVAWTPVHGPPTWEVFVEKFTAKYYPTSFKEKMDVALRNIKQGNKTVDEYDTEFSKIVHFVDHINHNEPEKARRFFEGLNSECRHVMGANRLKDYFTVVEQARGMELQIQLTKSEAAHTSGTNGTSRSKRSHQDGIGLSERPAFKKSREDEQSQHTSKPRPQFSSPPRHMRTKFMRPAPGQGMICFRCGQNYRASECDFSGTCDQCGKSGHMRNVCKENPDSIIKWQLVTPLEGSSTGGSSHPANSGFISSHGSVQMMAAPPQFPPLPTNYYWQATPLPGPYAPLPLPAPYASLPLAAPTTIPPPHQPVGDSSTLIKPGIYTMPPTSSHGLSDGVTGTRASGAGHKSFG